MFPEAALSRSLSPMLPAYPPAPGLYMATGPRLLPSWFLTALLPALRCGGRVFWIDAGNGFDAYGMSYAARVLGFDPKPLLSRVRLARAFNLWQLETMVRSKLPREWRGEPVVVSDVLAPFCEEDVPAAEARRVAASVREGMRSLPALWMALAVERPVSADRRGLLEDFTGKAAGVAALKSVSGPRWKLELAGA